MISACTVRVVTPALNGATFVTEASFSADYNIMVNSTTDQVDPFFLCILNSVNGMQVPCR